jgi:cytochrome c oxidase assembly factor CtaG
MKEIKQALLKLTELFTLLAAGFLVTFYILKPAYESSGIQFIGNVWVNWFGVTYLLFVFYTLIAGLLLVKESMLYKQRMSSVFFWLLFIGSNYVVFVPFLRGENPF